MKFWISTTILFLLKAQTYVTYITFAPLSNAAFRFELSLKNKKVIKVISILAPSTVSTEGLRYLQFWLTVWFLLRGYIISDLTRSEILDFNN